MIPSVKTIDASGLVSNIDDAKYIRQIMAKCCKAKDKYEFFDWVNETCSFMHLQSKHHYPEAFRCKLDVAMALFDGFLNGFGIECIQESHVDLHDPPIVTYINMGDTYNPTICYRHDINRFLVSDYGTQVEILERKGIKTC